MNERNYRARIDDKYFGAYLLTEKQIIKAAALLNVKPPRLETFLADREMQDYFFNCLNQTSEPALGGLGGLAQ